MHFIICVKNHVLWNRNTKTQMFMHKRKENKLLLIEHWKENKEARLTFIFLLLRKWHWNIDTEKAVLIFTPSCYVRSCQGIKLFSTRITAAHSFPYPKTAAWEELTVVTPESGIFAKTPGIWTPEHFLSAATADARISGHGMFYLVIGCCGIVGNAGPTLEKV